MKKILGLLLGLFIMQAVFSHYKAKYHVIVDTDGGKTNKMKRWLTACLAKTLKEQVGLINKLPLQK